ncbi:hypothetical protein BDM02DRAFT_3127415 [Thelephora ganbajun]|uniref:Uncharacterized protein n=1 Tax=Thelephora ganbajun TaxID=370292 RepID=A0ACB6ZN95_THEGA|nr:hypothetical protein BDM02DRAFT_3127415 [Thelephora ganbajun]
MYPKWLVFVLTLLSCLFLMASAAPAADGNVTPVKRLKQFQLRRPSGGDSIVARVGTVVEHAKRDVPSPSFSSLKRGFPDSADVTNLEPTAGVPDVKHEDRPGFPLNQSIGNCSE